MTRSDAPAPDAGPEDNALAADLLRCLSEGRQIAPLTARAAGLSLSRAYRVGQLVEAARTRAGARPVGRKIGFTNRTIWTQYNVSAPIFGPMYYSTVRPLSDAPEPVGALLEPRIEPEIAFRLSAAPEPGMDPEALIACISHVCAGFELVQSAYPGWRFEAADTVAAFGLHGAFLHGPEHPVAPQDRADWVARLADFRTRLSCDGTHADDGHAENVLGGGPLVALAHLVDLAAGMGDPFAVRAGEIVTTGTLTQALPIAPGQTWRAEFDGLPLAPIALTLA